MTRILSIDFETYSTTDITVGPSRYADDLNTGIWCAAYAFDDEPVHRWWGITGRGVIPAIEDHIHAGGIVRAWNASFERALWRVAALQFGWSTPRPEQFVCSAALAARAGLPRTLEKAAKVLGLPEQKDMEGHRLMLRMCRPVSFYQSGDPIWYTPSPVDANRLLAYCAQDVEVERAVVARLPKVGNAFERKIFLLDQTINDRGVQVDVPLVIAARSVANGAVKAINTQLHTMTQGEVTGVTKVAKLKDWLAKQGLTIDSLAKAPMRDLLAGDTLPPELRSVLLLRQQGGKSSTAKLTTMLACASPIDDRVRGMLRYYGAGTGRWAGQTVQPQNFPRGTVKVTEEHFELIRSGDWEYVDTFLDRDVPLMDLMASMLRGCFVPAVGHDFVTADFSAIEARVLAWLAGAEKLLHAFRTGGSAYLDMSEVIYGRRVSKKLDPIEYQVSKNTVLGCFGSRTPVLTSRGWVPIIAVQRDDLLWDGIEWVQHDGVADQGAKQTIDVCGMRVTPDHRVWVTDQWRSARFLAGAAGSHSLRLAHDSVNLPCWVSSGGHGVGVWPSWWPAPADILARCMSPTSGRGDQPGVTVAPKSKPGERTKFTLTLYPTRGTETGCSIGCPPHSPGVTLPGTAIGPSMGGGESMSPLNGTAGRANAGGLLTSSLSPGGMMHGSKWTGGTTTEDMSPGTSGSALGQRTWRIGKPLPNSEPVYDILNSGSRNRFTVLTASGPLIVHNCGYQMGGDKFVEQLQIQTGIVLEPEFGKRAVDAYRSLYWEVPLLWRSMNTTVQAVVAGSVQDWTEVPASRGLIAFAIDESGWLTMRLPSGRSLWYPSPRMSSRMAPWGEKVPCVTVAGVNSVTKQWTREALYGGLLTENAVQAIARDLMAEAMFRVEAAGYPVVLTVHDEIVSEPPVGHGSLEEFTTLMSALPDWAAGCPVSAEGWRGNRYRKG